MTTFSFNSFICFSDPDNIETFLFHPPGLNLPYALYNEIGDLRRGTGDKFSSRV